MNMKIGLAIGVAAAAIMTMAGSASAEDRLATILARGKILVGTGSTNPPWHFKDDQGVLVGYDVDMGHLLAKAIFDDPEKVEYVVQSSDSRIPNVLTDKVDITCQFMTVTAGRAQQVDFTIPYYREGVGLLLMKSGKHKNYDDLKAAGSGATVSVLQNVYAEEMVHQALPEAKVDQYESVDLMYQALNSGRADAAATDMSSAKWFVTQNPDQYIEGGYGWNPQTYSCAVKKGDLEFLHFVDIAFREAMTGVDFPTYAASFKKWFGEEPPAPQVGFPGELR
jgi:polar amino acid transport system substrate-binding protein